MWYLTNTNGWVQLPFVGTKPGRPHYKVGVAKRGLVGVLGTADEAIVGKSHTGAGGEMKYLGLACGTYCKEKLSTGSKWMLYEMLSLELENTST